jgi:hypothetical protein
VNHRFEIARLNVTPWVHPAPAPFPAAVDGDLSVTLDHIGYVHGAHDAAIGRTPSIVRSSPHVGHVTAIELFTYPRGAITTTIAAATASTSARFRHRRRRKCPGDGSNVLASAGSNPRPHSGQTPLLTDRRSYPQARQQAPDGGV